MYAETNDSGHSNFNKSVNDTKRVLFRRLFYAGAIEGQMPEILTMIQVEKSTPAPAVLFVVSQKQLHCHRAF